MHLLVVDDHPIIAMGIRKYLAARTDVVVEGVSSLTQARAAIKEWSPAVIFLDIALPDGSGLDFARELTSGGRQEKIIMLSDRETPVLIGYALDSGAKGFLSKSSDEKIILSALDCVDGGGIWISEAFLQPIAFMRMSNPGGSILTPRERSIIRLLAEGQSLAEVGANLGVSYRTIAADSSSLKTKLGVQSVPELVRIGAEMRLF